MCVTIVPAALKRKVLGGIFVGVLYEVYQVSPKFRTPKFPFPTKSNNLERYLRKLTYPLTQRYLLVDDFTVFPCKVGYVSFVVGTRVSWNLVSS